MAEFILTPESKKDGIYFLSEINNGFENIYLRVRENENRIYSTKELEKLPFASDSNQHKQEWDLRAKSFLRLKEYLRTKKEDLNILDLGCGNSWLCGQLLKVFNFKFYCIDVNLTELKQGRNTFKSERIKFIYADIFNSHIPHATFDIVILNAAVQYFPDIKKLLNRLSNLLNDTGEIHIIDSPFYSRDEVAKAKNRTMDYYQSINFPEMAEYYHHHTLDELLEFNYQILYLPNSTSNRLKRLFSFKNSPFPWIRIIK